MPAPQNSERDTGFKPAAERPYQPSRLDGIIGRDSQEMSRSARIVAKLRLIMEDRDLALTIGPFISDTFEVVNGIYGGTEIPPGELDEILAIKDRTVRSGSAFELPAEMPMGTMYDGLDDALLNPD